MEDLCPLPLSLKVRYRQTWVRNLVFSLLLLCTETAVAQTFFALEKNRKSLSLPFVFQRNLIIIPVFLNGKGPYNFLLDTGVSHAIVTNPNLIDTLKLTQGTEITLTGAGSTIEDLKAMVFPKVKVTLPGVRSDGMSMTFLSEDIFNLSSYVGMPVAGILGFQFFNSFIVKVDFVKSIVTLYNPKTFKYHRRLGIQVPFELVDQKPYLYALTSLDQNKPISTRLILDTGAGHALSLEQSSSAQIRVPDNALRTHLGTGLSGSIMGYIGRINNFQLHKYHFKNLLTSFPDYADVSAKVTVGRNGNLGNELLKRFTVIIDYSRSRLTLRPNSQFRQPFEHDMCGLEIIATSEEYNRFFITKVEAGSPAEEADLMPGDEIVFIDSHPARSLSISQIDRLFRYRNGYRLVLVLKRQNQLIFRFVTLRRKV